MIPHGSNFSPFSSFLFFEKALDFEAKIWYNSLVSENKLFGLTSLRIMVMLSSQGVGFRFFRVQNLYGGTRS